MFKIIIPILLLTGAIFLGKYLVATGPEAKKKPFVERLPVVEVTTLKPQNYTVTLTASGTVKAGTQTSLVSEVSGRVLSISNKFQEGGYFNKGETLLTIDQENYKNALAIVASDVAANRAVLNQIKEEEKSTKRSYQLAQKNLSLGRKEVRRLNGLLKKKVIARSTLDIEQQKTNQLQQKLEDLQGRINTFESRKQATIAKISATLARQKQEKLNLSRTSITAPYSGRVLEKKVDIGQFVGTGTILGKIYATDYVEVALPLSLNRYELLGLPEAFKNKSVDEEAYPEVIFSNPSSHQNNQWIGRVVRTSAALDLDSRQIIVITRVDNPFDAKKGISSPLRIGQYIEGKIAGKTFKDVFVLPPIAVRQNKEILLFDDGKINVVPVTTLWNSQKETVVRISQNVIDKQLVITAMSQATEGMKVITVAQQQKKNSEKRQRKAAKKAAEKTVLKNKNKEES